MSKPRWAVDWDGTAATDAWPAFGPWMPGAPEALRKMARHGEIVIHTCRIAPYEQYDINLPRPVAKVQEEKDGIRRMLDAEGLHDVLIWDRPFKPPADLYIDNKGLHYNGRPGAWKAIWNRIAIQHGIDADL